MSRDLGDDGKNDDDEVYPPDFPDGPGGNGTGSGSGRQDAEIPATHRLKLMVSPAVVFFLSIHLLTYLASYLGWHRQSLS